MVRPTLTVDDGVAQRRVDAQVLVEGVHRSIRLELHSESGTLRSVVVRRRQGRNTVALMKRETRGSCVYFRGGYCGRFPLAQLRVGTVLGFAVRAPKELVS